MAVNHAFSKTFEYEPEEELRPQHPSDVYPTPEYIFELWNYNMVPVQQKKDEETPFSNDKTDQQDASKVYRTLLAKQWDELVEKTIIKPPFPFNSKTSSSSHARTMEEIHEDVSVISLIQCKKVTICFQCNGDTNTSVTNSISILHHVKSIPLYSIGEIVDGIKCKQRGIYYIQCENNAVIPIHMYQSEEATEKLISPTNIVTKNGGI